MTVMLHPNKIEPKRYRVWDKELGEQAYYPLTEEGRKAADEHQERINRKKETRAMARNLGINKLFRPDGSVKGLKRKYRKRKDRDNYEYFALYAQKQQTDIIIREDNFEDAYRRSQLWLMEKLDIEETFEIRQMFKKAKSMYWTSVAPESEQAKQKLLDAFNK